MIVAAFISDRGDRHLPDCIESFCKYMPHVAATTVINDREHKLGLAGAARAAWAWALQEGADYLWHQEEDWLFNDYIDLDGMRWTLEQNPQLAQMVLRRGIEYANAHEVKAGGWIEANPDPYIQHGDGGFTTWMEHRQNFSLNPCLIPRKILELGWDNDNERGFSKVCLDLGYTFGVWGPKVGPPHITHTGQSRSAGWRP